MKTIHFIYESGILSTQIGKILVAYYELEKKVRVVKIEDGSILNEHDFIFDLTEFIGKINAYDVICNHK